VEQGVEHRVEPRVGAPAGPGAHVVADRLGAGRRRRAGELDPPGGGRLGQCQDGTGGPALAQPGQCGPGRLAAGHHHCGQRRAGGGLERLFPPAVHLDQVEQRADDAVDPGQQLGPGRTPGLVEGPLQRVGPGLGPGVLLLGLAEGLLGRLEASGRGHQCRLGLGPCRLELMATLLGLGQALAELVVLALEQGGPPLGRPLAGDELVQGPPVALQRVLERGQLPPCDGDGLLGLAELAPVPPGRQVRLELGGGGRLGGGQPDLLGHQRVGLLPGRGQLLAQPGALGLQRRDDIGVGGGVERLGQRALAFPQHPGQAAGTLHHALGAPERGGQIRLPLGRQLVRGALRVGVELAEGRLQLGLPCPLFVLEPVPLGPLAVQGAELGPRDVQPHRPELVGQPGVGPGRGRLALERPDLPLHFADQVEQALEVLLGRRQAALGPLPAAAVLEDPGRLLDDRATVLRPGLQDGVEVALTDDHVLLAAHPGVGQQLLDVEQPARRPVDRVLAVT
jgi:hypothetical protein